MKDRLWILLAALLMGLGFVGVAWMYKAQTAQAPAVAPVDRALLERPHAVRLGPASAPVVITEFFDPACETCRRFFPLVKELMAQHPQDIQLVMRHAPLHMGSDQVVLAMEAAREQDLYWPVLTRLLDTQDQWSIQHRPNLARALAVLQSVPNLDLARLQADMQRPEVQNRLKQDMDDLQRAGVRATPEFFVNGQGLPSFGHEQLLNLVNETLKAQGR